ncbi:hypothetical protein Sru01_04190 [Sphaerisporangium rufum]|uniref:Methyltransferase domain-containing protein n=1 Tax=Sphaerisporangium rufum TaxID=1381558 RepID=A0A919QWV2_9ACTN|nr:class I SAM-dependent methyltransferase [Sphaerisporangium rufum]GII75437.1 hypothetical protein Sru01_04190 [Sphaerisporangium rufum]
MGLGKILHDHSEHAGRHEHGGTIDRPRAYDIMTWVLFGGGRRAAFTRMAALAKPRSGDRILDVGCGTGYLTRILSPVVMPSGHVTGLDLAPEMVEYARRRAPGNCDYVVGAGQDLPFDEGSFDTVISTFAVHHIPGGLRAAAMREMYRVLRPGGQLLIIESRPPASRPARDLVRRLSPAMRHAPEDLLGTMVPDAGFEVESQGPLPGLRYHVRARRP